MKLRVLPRLALWLFLGVIPSMLLAQQRVVVDVAAGKDTISRHIYGHFSEHLGRCIYGGFYMGEKAGTTPTTRGIRNDVVAALKKIRIPNLRWPGGCFADTYHWKDGIGPKAQRPVIVNVWWGGVTEDNSFGTHEFLDLCEQLGAEPYFSGNVGSGTVRELVEWVQYTNFEGTSPMSTLRAQNGHPAPWHVRYWGLGNETWGCGGTMSAEYYANIYKQYATFVGGAGSAGPLTRIASGAASDDYHWTEVLLRDVPHSLLEAVGLHHYAVIDWNDKGPATAFTTAQYAITMRQALRMEEFVTKHTAVMDKYDPTKKIGLVVDEWGGWYEVEPGTNGAFLYQQNTMRDAMIAGVSLNIFNNHCDRVRMANLAQTVNVLQAVLLTDSSRLVLTPTYHVMEMYTVHHDAVMLPVQVTATPYIEGKDTLPAVSVSASRDAKGAIHVSLVNIDPAAPRAVALEFKGKAVHTASGRILVSPKIQDHNTFEDPSHVVPKPFQGAAVQSGSVKVTLPPCSVVVLTLE